MTKATANVFLRKDKEINGEMPLYLRVTVNGKSQKRSLGKRIHKKHWDFKSNRPRKSHPNSTHLTNYILNEIAKADKEIMHLENEGKSIDSKKLMATIKNEGGLFFEFCKEFIKSNEGLVTVGTLRRYSSVIAKFKRYHKEDFKFNQLTQDKLDDFKRYCFHQKNSQNTVNSNLRVLRTITKSAIKEGLLRSEKSPFLEYPIKRDEGSKERLSYEEVKVLQQLNLKKNTGKYDTRQYFMFSFFTGGMRISDVIKLRVDNIIDGRISYKMTKTGHSKSIKITPTIKNIIDQYQGQNGDYIFPILNTLKNLSDPEVMHSEVNSKSALINKNLKDLATDAGIEKKLSFHMARHSFADMARKENIPLYDIKNMLGHSDIKVTQAYLNSFDEESLDDGMSKIHNLFN